MEQEEVHTEYMSLKRYIEEIKAIPRLSFREECRILDELKQGKMSHLNKLVTSSLYLVLQEVKRYLDADLPLLDLIQEGTLGLIEAAKKYRYNSEGGVSFKAYARSCIYWTIRNSLNTLVNEIRIPLTHMDSVLKIRDFVRQYRQRYYAPLSLSELAQGTNLSMEEIKKVIKLPLVPLSLDWEVDKAAGRTVTDFIIDESYASPEEDVMKDSLRDQIEAALSTLEPREAEIIRLHYGIGREESLTLDEIGERYGLTRERVRQIKVKALRRLRHISRRRRLWPYYNSDYNSDTSNGGYSIDPSLYKYINRERPISERLDQDRSYIKALFADIGKRSAPEHDSAHIFEDRAKDRISTKQAIERVLLEARSALKTTEIIQRVQTIKDVPANTIHTILNMETGKLVVRVGTSEWDLKERVSKGKTDREAQAAQILNELADNQTLLRRRSDKVGRVQDQSEVEDFLEHLLR